MKIKKPTIHATNGPSLTVPYKAIIVEYENFEEHENFAVSEQEKIVLRAILPETVKSNVNFGHIKNIDSLLIELMRAFINIRDELDLKIELKTNDKNNKLICLEYLYQEQIRPPINAALGITAHIKADVVNSPQQINGFINQVTQNSLILSPKMALNSMLQSAKRTQIPFYPIDATDGIFSYGQGKNSLFFDFAGPQIDSQIGGKLQTDKAKTNAYLKLLGYTTTQQKVVRTIEACHEAAKQLSPPLFIKPATGSHGLGITGNITQHEQIAEAFKAANNISNGNVIIENHVDGDAHRFTVTNGKVIGISCIYPAFVVGDGKHNIRQLIDIENIRRDTPEKNELIHKKIVIDETVIQNLHAMGMDENSIPQMSTRINLRHTSNASTGGKILYMELKDPHPDNLKMAIDITRLFKLNCSGIDYITPDISRSWREVGAVIEVNSQPGVGKMLADGILKSHFADKNNGLIESTLVITNNDKFSQKITQIKTADGAKVGYADMKIAILDDEVKRTAQDELYDNCRSLLIHPDCDKIVVSMTSEKIAEFGLPLDYFEHCIIDPDCKDDADIKQVKEFLKKHVGQITRG